MRYLRVLAWVWVVVLVLAGLGGGIVMSRVGWALAEGLTIYTGNTEPVRPDLPYPWLIYALFVLVSAVGIGWLVRDRRARRPEAPAPSWLRAVAPLAVAYAGGLSAAVLPFVHLFRLFAAVQAAAGVPTP